MDLFSWHYDVQTGIFEVDFQNFINGTFTKWRSWVWIPWRPETPVRSLHVLPMSVCVFSSVPPASSYICDRWISDPKLTFAVNVSV